MANKILVTGGSGLVGGFLKEILPDAIYVSSSDFDLTSIKEVEILFKTYNPNIVIHLAAKVGGLIDNINFPADYYDDNIMMNTNTLKIAHKYGVDRFVGILSSCAFPDEVKNFPIKEESLHEGPPNKSQFSYGISKRSFAVQIDAYNKQYKTNYQYLTPCNLYGESEKFKESKSHYITDLIKKIYKANKKGDDHIVLYGDGKPLRQFMHAKDMAEIIKIIIDRNITESFNVAPKKTISIKDIAKIALIASDSQHLDIKFDSSMPNGQIRKDLDTSKMNNLIPDYEFISMKDGINSFYNFYKKIKSKKKYILVTGGLGYIGSHTVVELINNGYIPIIIDNLSNSNIDILKKIKKITGEEVFFLQGDLRSVNNLDYIFKKFKIDSVIHFAAFKSVSESTKYPLDYYDNNLNSTIQLLKSMKKYGVKNIVFSSSCTVYGQPENYPVDENTPIKKAESPYGETKRMCEQILEKTQKSDNINVIILRYFNPIGAHESGFLYENPKGIPDNLIPYITGVINGKYPFLKIFGKDYDTKDGTAVRDYININDLAAVHVKSLDVIENIGFDIFNVGSGNGNTVMEVVESFKKNGANIAFKILPRRNGDIESIYGDISKAERILKWTPTRTLDDSINSILNIKL